MKKLYTTLLLAAFIMTGMAQKVNLDRIASMTPNTNWVQMEPMTKSAVQATATIATMEVVPTTISSIAEALKAKQAKQAAQAAALDTQYPLPEGAFYEGFARFYGAYAGVFLHYPAFKTLEFWPWATDKDATFEWLYYAQSVEESTTLIGDEVEEDGTLNFVPGITPEGYYSYIPMLKATAGEETATFVMGQGSEYSFGLGSYVERSLTEDGTVMDGQMEFGTMTLANLHLNRGEPDPNDQGNLYGSFGGNNVFGPAYSNDKGACVGVMQLMPALLSPMYVESITALAVAGSGDVVPEGGALTLGLYYLNTDGSFGDLIAEATTDEFEVTHPNNIQGVFIFKFEEEEDGFITDKPVVIDAGAPVALIITGFDADWDFSFLFGANDGFGGTAYTLHGEDLAIATFGYSNAPNTPLADLYIQFNAMFNALDFYFEEDNAIDFPIDGGWGIVGEDEGEPYNDLAIASAFNIDDDMEDVWIEEAPEWIVDFDYDNSYFEDYNALFMLFAADALPEGVAGRSGEIVIASHGIKLNIPVTQGNISGIKPTFTTDVKVSANDLGFKLSYPATYSQVAVYNTAGQMLGQYTLPATGEFIVPANQGNGVYILQLNGSASTTIKVVK